MTINVSAIQHFSVGDGPGIRTTVFLKGCNLHCPWCHNPETQRKEPETVLFPNGRPAVYGKEMTPEEILAELREDADFYGDDGGVTFSGGEPLLQADALAPLLGLLRREPFSVIVDTAGCVDYSAFEKLNFRVDCYFVDLKAPDNGGYGTLGGSFDRVFENIGMLKQDGKKLRIRIPVIPGFNAEETAVRRICEKLRELGEAEADLIPFHRMGSSKYAGLGREYAYADVKPMTKEEIRRVAEQYENNGIKTRTEE